MPPLKKTLSPDEHFNDYVYDLSSYAEFGYELTITLNPMIWSKHDSWKADTLIEDHLYQWLCPGYNPHHISAIVLVKEYTKVGMSHYHLAVFSESELQPEFRDGIIKGMQRIYGRTSFKTIMNRAAYTEYQGKDLEKNTREKGYDHYKIILEV